VCLLKLLMGVVDIDWLIITLFDDINWLAIMLFDELAWFREGILDG